MFSWAVVSSPRLTHETSFQNKQAQLQGVEDTFVIAGSTSAFYDEGSVLANSVLASEFTSKNHLRFLMVQLS